MDGYNQGTDESWEENMRGYMDGYNNGTDVSWEVVYDEGCKDGYNEGWDDCIANALKKDAYDKTSAYDEWLHSWH